MKRVFLFLFVSLMFSASSVFAQNHFTPEEFNCESNCNLYFGVTLDGEALASSDIEVAAFVDGVCRQTGYLGDGAPSGNYTWGMMQIPHDGVVTATFKMYDHATETEYDVCSTTITTQPGEEIMGIDEQFNLDLVVIAFTSSNVEPTGPEYPWIPVVNAYPDQMSIDAVIQINGVTLTEDNRWEVGVFCGDECRGDQKVFTHIQDGPTIMMISVNGQDGEVLNFYLYDMAAGSQHPGVCSTMVFDSEGSTGGSILEPITLNFVYEQTFTLDITGYTTDSKDHYYLIASPIGEVSPGNVTNMLENEYDLYYFDQNQDLEWINYKDQTDGGYDLNPGMGYLYANSADVTLTFTGVAYNGSGEVTLTKATDEANVDFQGWNLVGNPFAETATIDKPFYTMNDDGTEVIAGEGNEIAAMQGIFVIADNDGETMTFSTGETGDKAATLVMNVTHNRGSVIDRAIVRFGEGSQLPKFQLNKNNTKIYIPQDNKDYAVVTASDMGEMPVSFKAAENGIYTLCFNSEEMTFSYLHLVDNMTGADVDVLENPSYTFNALTTDYASRFKLVFATGQASDDSFAFLSNGNWIINNDGKANLQVIDVTGRILKSEQIEGCYSLNLKAAPGVYMFRLVNGNDMKVQKVVVK